MSEVHPITFRLKVFNAWRRGNEAPQPDPKTVGEDIDSICDIAKRLEIERDELKTILQKTQQELFEMRDHYADATRRISAERALADLLASSLLLTLSAWITSPDAERAAAALRVWKEARSE